MPRGSVFSQVQLRLNLKLITGEYRHTKTFSPSLDGVVETAARVSPSPLIPTLEPKNMLTASNVLITIIKKNSLVRSLLQMWTQDSIPSISTGTHSPESPKQCEQEQGKTQLHEGRSETVIICR